MKSIVQEKEGTRYGTLTVVGFAGQDKNGYGMWEVRCDCGNTKTVRGCYLRNSQTTTCGDRKNHRCAKKGTSTHYSRLHDIVRATWGSASQYPCVDGCGEIAYDWSHTHDTDPRDVLNYMPRCRGCHRAYDRKIS